MLGKFRHKNIQQWKVLWIRRWIWHSHKTAFQCNHQKTFMANIVSLASHTASGRRFSVLFTRQCKHRSRSIYEELWCDEYFSQTARNGERNNPQTRFTPSKERAQRQNINFKALFYLSTEKLVGERWCLPGWVAAVVRQGNFSKKFSNSIDQTRLDTKLYVEINERYLVISRLNFFSVTEICCIASSIKALMAYLHRAWKRPKIKCPIRMSFS